MIVVGNIVLMVMGWVLWRYLMRHDLAFVTAAFLWICAGIIALHVGYRLVTGHWMNPAIRVGPRGFRTGRKARSESESFEDRPALE